VCRCDPLGLVRPGHALRGAAWARPARCGLGSGRVAGRPVSSETILYFS